MFTVLGATRFSLVSFDVDGTIFRRGALTEAARGLGIAQRWDAYDEMFHKKRITLRECLESQYRLLSGMKVGEVLREVARVETIRNVRETVEKLQGHGLQVILLTDNPDFLCQYLVEQFGFSGYVSSKVGVKDGVISEDIEPLPDKRLGIRKYCAWLSVPLRRCVHVGDWVNDVPVFRVVGYSVALNSKYEKVRRAASFRMDTDDLLDVYRHIQSVNSTGSREVAGNELAVDRLGSTYEETD